MRAALLSTVVLWSVGALAAPTQEVVDPVTGLYLPHSYEEIDLADYEGLTASNITDRLQERTQVQVCSYTTHQGRCKGILPGEGLEYDTKSIADRFIDASNNNNCAHFTGGAYGFNWDQHASNKNPSSRDCTTTSEVGTIHGALENYFAQTGYTTCGVKCLQLKHGDGTWRGYVSFGVNSYTASAFACGPHSANVCYSGGKKDCDGQDCG